MQLLAIPGRVRHGHLQRGGLFRFLPSWFCFQALKEIYATDAVKAKEMAMERRKNGTIEMSAARMASMMEEAGGGEVGGDVPMVKVRSTQDAWGSPVLPSAG